MFHMRIVHMKSVCCLFVLGIGLEAIKSVPTGNGAVFQVRHKLMQLLHKKNIGLQEVPLYFDVFIRPESIPL